MQIFNFFLDFISILFPLVVSILKTPFTLTLLIFNGYKFTYGHVPLVQNLDIKMIKLGRFIKNVTIFKNFPRFHFNPISSCCFNSEDTLHPNIAYFQWLKIHWRSRTFSSKSWYKNDKAGKINESCCNHHAFKIRITTKT